MVIDTSALLAILLQEPDAAELAERIERDPVRLLSAGTLLELAMMIETRRGAEGGRDLDLMLHRMGAEVVGFSAEQAEVARAAFRRYGKGRHAAGLNFGDCMAYALAQVAGEPLLYKSGDFASTELG